jgi:phospholipase/lecithinase/hemolysin
MASFVQRSSMVVGVAGSIAAISSPAVAANAPAPIGEILVFGDSLSDTGNILAFTSTGPASQIGFTPRPSVPWYKAGQFTNGEGGNAGLPATRFTNGVWVRTLADVLGRTRPASVGLDPTNNPLGTNYAWGGAQATGGFILPAVTTQVTSYINGRASLPNNPLHVFWAGGNDLVNAATAGNATPASIAAAGTNAVNAMKTSIKRLIDRMDPLSPMQFLWANLPSLDRTPTGAALPANLRTALRDASAAFAVAQSEAILELTEPSANITIHRLDVFGLFNNLLDNPLALGFANATGSILSTTNFATPGPFNPTLAVPNTTDPDTFVFWDSLHPTSRVHAIIGNEAARIIPSPAAMLTLAMGGLVAARRRR